MRSLHYPIQLPPGYDMRAIDQRVRDRAHAFEALPGLRLKLFLVQRLADGAAANAYAPFYVWDTTEAMRDFLIGPLFRAVVDSFGRPAVIDRQVLEFALVDRALRVDREGRAIAPVIATMEPVVFGAGVDPARIVEGEKAEHARAMKLGGLFAATTVLDTTLWRATRVRLWADENGAALAGPSADRYRVVRAVGPALHD